LDTAFFSRESINLEVLGFFPSKDLKCYCVTLIVILHTYLMTKILILRLGYGYKLVGSLMKNVPFVLFDGEGEVFGCDKNGDFSAVPPKEGGNGVLEV
jgi:hypothetical protein